RFRSDRVVVRDVQVEPQLSVLFCHRDGGLKLLRLQLRPPFLSKAFHSVTDVTRIGCVRGDPFRDKYSYELELSTPAALIANHATVGFIVARRPDLTIDPAAGWRLDPNGEKLWRLWNGREWDKSAQPVPELHYNKRRAVFYKETWLSIRTDGQITLQT